MAEDGVLGHRLVRLRQLGVDLGQLVHRRRDAEARHVRRQQLLVEGVAQDVRLAPLLLPRPVAAAAAVPAAAVLAVIAVGAGAGLTLGGEPLVVRGGGGAEPRAGGGGRRRRRLVVRGGVVIGEDGVEDGGGGGGVVVVVVVLLIGVAREVKGNLLLGEVVVVLKRHGCVKFPKLQRLICIA